MSEATTSIAPTARVHPSVIIEGRGELVIGEHAVLEPHVLIDLGRSGTGRVILGARSKVKFCTAIRTYGGEIAVGSGTSLGEHGLYAAHGGIKIGDSVIVASHCSMTASEHIYSASIPIRYQGETTEGIAIGDGVWLGAGCSVLDGVSLGDGCIAGAGAVITRGFPPGSILTGVPARRVKKRIGKRSKQ